MSKPETTDYQSLDEVISAYSLAEKLEKLPRHILGASGNALFIGAELDGIKQRTAEIEAIFVGRAAEDKELSNDAKRKAWVKTKLDENAIYQHLKADAVALADVKAKEEIWLTFLRDSMRCAIASTALD